MAIILAGKVKPIKNFDRSQIPITLENPPEIRISLGAMKGSALSEQPQKLLRRQKVAAIRKALRKDPNALSGVDGSEERKRLMEDLLDARGHYAKEMGISLWQLKDYGIAMKMLEMLKEEFSDALVISLLKMSGSLRQEVRQERYDPQNVRCAGEVRSLASLIKDLHFMHHHLERKNYLDAIAIYRKLTPQREGRKGTGKGVYMAAEIVMADGKLTQVAEPFIEACYQLATGQAGQAPLPKAACTKEGSALV